MIHRKQITRTDGTMVVLSIEGAYSWMGKLECCYWAKVLRPGSTEWTNHYPIRKCDMWKSTVEQYLKEGWGSIVKPNEVLGITLELIKRLHQPA